VRHNYITYCLKRDASLPALLNLLYTSTNQQLFKVTSAIKVVTISIMNGSHHVRTKLFTAVRKVVKTMSKDEWDTKQGTGKPMKNALQVQHYGKRHLLG